MVGSLNEHVHASVVLLIASVFLKFESHSIGHYLIESEQLIKGRLITGIVPNDINRQSIIIRGDCCRNPGWMRGMFLGGENDR